MKYLSASVLFVIAGFTANATLLLEVDVSNPSSVTLTATGANADAPDSSFNVADGFNLLDFFTGSVSLPPGQTMPITSGLFSYGQNTAYSHWFTDSYSGFGRDLNIWKSSIASSSSPTQVFKTQHPSFTGLTTIDLSTWAGLLPSVGTISDIRPGYTYTEYGTPKPLGPVIGQWAVIPEPSTFALVFGILALVVGGTCRFRRR
jgi:hypothetical protein